MRSGYDAICATYNVIQYLLGLNPRKSRVEEEIRAYQNKDKPAIPDTINFADEKWAEAIQADINEINNAINSTLLIGSVCGGGGAYLLSYVLPLPFNACVLALAGLIYRNDIKSNLQDKLDKLIAVFEKLTPEDTGLPVAMNLATVIATLVTDEAVINKWMKLDKNTPQQVFAKANPEFIKIFADKGFFKYEIRDTLESAEADCRAEEQRFKKSGVLGNLSLLKKHSYAAFYGKGDLSLNYKYGFYLKTFNNKEVPVQTTVTLSLR